VRRPVAWFIAALVLATAHAPHAAPSPNIVISQVYAGGGNTGAPFQNDFVELFNRGSEPVSIAGWSIQYASATGTGNFSAQRYQRAVGHAGTGPVLPRPPGRRRHRSAAARSRRPEHAVEHEHGRRRREGGAAQYLGRPGLQRWLRSMQRRPTGADRRSGRLGQRQLLRDGGRPRASNTTALFRAAGGCTETDNNAADFSAAAPAPRNTAAPLSPCVSDVPPSISSTVPTHGAAQVALSANVIVTFSEDVTAGAGAFSISCTNSGSHPVDVTGGPAIFTLNPSTDFSSSEACTLTVHAAQVTDQDGAPTAMASDATVTFNTVEVCGDPRTSISTIQGSGPQSSMTGASVSIEGLVVASYQGSGQFGGYFVQEEDGKGDGDPATSDGIFVFSATVPVAAGDKVRVRGTVTEFASSGTFLTELSSVASAQVLFYRATPCRPRLQ
jgi:predicted extracellular nuclease